MQREKPKPLITRRIAAGMAMEGKRPAEMAKLLRISTRTWERWVRDPTHYLTPVRLAMIATILKTTAAALITEE